MDVMSSRRVGALLRDSPANLCVNGLLELFVVDNGSDFALAVGRPVVGCQRLNTGDPP